jgi:DinB superfamily
MGAIMSSGTSNLTGDPREAALLHLDQGQEAFRKAIEGAPEESLGFLKPGDEYALGGLVHHVNAVLEHYLDVLKAVVASGFQETKAGDRPGLFEEAASRARAGLASGERSPALAAMARMHQDVRRMVLALRPEDFERKAPVFYQPGTEPYHTSPADVVGWLAGHYDEHAAQAEELLATWQRRG